MPGMYVCWCLYVCECESRWPQIGVPVHVIYWEGPNGGTANALGVCVGRWVNAHSITLIRPTPGVSNPHSGQELLRHTHVIKTPFILRKPFCRADIYFIETLVLYLNIYIIKYVLFRFETKF